MGWACSCRRPGGSPSLRKRPGVSAQGGLCFGWLGVSPSLLFRKQSPATPAAPAPAVMAGVHRCRGSLLGSSTGADISACENAHRPLSAKPSPRAHAVFPWVKRVRLPLAALLEISPVPRRRQFRRLSAQRWLGGTSPSGRWRC